MPDEYSYKEIAYLHSNQELSAIPKDVLKQADLVYKLLDLSYNKIGQLEDTIAELKVLKQLDLSNNQLKTLPDSFSALQNLEVLNLANNKLHTFPLVLTKLPKLKTLNLKGNLIQFLPPEIAKLQHLSLLEIGFNPLESLPQELATIQSLKTLICTSNRFAVFPAVLLEMEQLQDVKQLDLEFRLKLPNQRLDLFFKVLRHLKKQKANLKTKKAAFEILFTETCNQEKKDILPLLLVNYVAFSQVVRTYIVNNYSSSLTEGSIISILGATEWMDVEQLDDSTVLINEVSSSTTHIVLGRTISKQLLELLNEDLFFVSEKEVLAFFSPKQPADWLKEHHNKLLDLLRSNQNENIELALQLSKENELLDDMLTELLMAYTAVDAGNASLRSSIKEVFYRRIPDFEQLTLPSASFQFYTPNKTEHYIFQGIKNITNQTDCWDGLKIAHRLFKKYDVAYTYILEYSTVEEEERWLNQFVKGDSMTLSSLPKLSQLPKSIPCFMSIRRLNLRACNFRQFPDVDLLLQLPNLEEIDLRENPISFVPRDLFELISEYRIYLSK
ncbi:MAG: leucine-rich repeat domain-containing protein [Aureispira sp.]|nr:leucine-rich repeat domain-containing protein [Aureispira sp.]